MFIDRPSSKQRRVIAAPSSGAGFFESRSATISTPDEQAAAAHVADALVALAQLGEPGAQPGAGRRGALGEAVADDDLEDLERRRPPAAGRRRGSCRRGSPARGPAPRSRRSSARRPAASRRRASSTASGCRARRRRARRRTSCRCGRCRSGPRRARAASRARDSAPGARRGSRAGARGCRPTRAPARR